MEKCSKVGALYVACLRAISVVHQQNHWTTRGDNFYGDHLLFERLYTSATEDLDSAAEKFVGLFGSECLDYELQTKFLNDMLLRYKAIKSPVEKSLKIERDFLAFSKQAYERFESEDELTLGLDDMIMSISSNREESVYLLQQVLDKE